MDQLSLPYRIALVGILVFGLLYFVVLRGGDEPVGPATPAAATAPGVDGLTTAVEKAQSVATSAATTAPATPKTPAAPAATAAAPDTPVETTASATTPASRAESDDPSTPILARLKEGRTAVVLFSGRTAPDDKAVQRAVRRIARRDGKVDVYDISIRRVGAYEAITRGVQVLQAPTVLVIGKDRQARKIVGFTTTAEIDQLVADVRRG